mgnify:FL=1
MTIIYIARNPEKIEQIDENTTYIKLTTSVVIAEKENGVLVDKQSVPFGNDLEEAKKYYKKLCEEHPDYIQWS